jgi:hypothetical protein
MIQSRSPIRFAAAAAFFLFASLFGVCQPQPRSILCRNGIGNYDVELRNGVKLHVGAAREGGAATLATRACAAKFTWEKQELLVATGAAELDLDVFGVDMKSGAPVAAFQIKKTENDCCAEYRIYSLENPPRLVRTITGGEFFTAADTDLDDEIEIWTNDAAAINGFENLTVSELDSPPTVVLRFDHDKLLDVSAEFQSHYDGEISRTRSAMQSQDLQDFKNSDGKLAEMLTPASADRLHRLRRIKIKVLEIAWAYMYSGREADAWRALAEMWPSADAARIRGALEKSRAQGIRSQIDGASSGRPSGKRKKARIYEASNGSAVGGVEVAPPQSIQLEIPGTSDLQPSAAPEHELFLDLIIDKAGKVRSAKPAEKSAEISKELTKSAMAWKFIPAYKYGHSVASHLRIAVSPKK